MNIDHTILTVLILVPLVGAVLLALLPDKGRLMQWGALAVTLITFICTLHLPARYDYSAVAGSFQFEQNHEWINSPAIRYHLGVDGLSMWLVVLTGFLAPSASSSPGTPSAIAGSSSTPSSSCSRLR
ncbi:hypothetical protein [Tunturiibacter gelidiferens]|uniref:hypothetical protein n=1 Tax=Tunturiibacter gelidiferens TaxID=3069689 RepID=UPI003D9B0F25